MTDQLHSPARLDAGLVLHELDILLASIECRREDTAALAQVAAHTANRHRLVIDQGVDVMRSLRDNHEGAQHVAVTVRSLQSAATVPTSRQTRVDTAISPIWEANVAAASLTSALRAAAHSISPVAHSLATVPSDPQTALLAVAMCQRFLDIAARSGADLHFNLSAVLTSRTSPMTQHLGQIPVRSRVRQ